MGPGVSGAGKKEEEPLLGTRNLVPGTQFKPPDDPGVTLLGPLPSWYRITDPLKQLCE